MWEISQLLGTSVTGFFFTILKELFQCSDFFPSCLYNYFTLIFFLYLLSLFSFSLIFSVPIIRYFLFLFSGFISPSLLLLTFFPKLFRSIFDNLCDTALSGCSRETSPLLFQQILHF